MILDNIRNSMRSHFLLQNQYFTKNFNSEIKMSLKIQNFAKNSLTFHLKSKISQIDLFYKKINSV